MDFVRRTTMSHKYEYNDWEVADESPKFHRKSPKRYNYRDEMIGEYGETKLDELYSLKETINCVLAVDSEE